jgi:regulator of protease activity HflC (stomatin/prohibitin superfamily)
MSQSDQSYRQPEATPVGHEGSRVVIEERPAWAIDGWLGVVAVIAVVAGAIAVGRSSVPVVVALIIIAIVIASSLVIVQPGQTKVVRFFGSYVGTVRRSGLWWIAPLSDRRTLSVRVRNFETNHLKVNDADGNPVEIAAIVVWQVADTSRAVYAVDDFVNFITVQAESALRHVATTHPYDDAGDDVC